MYNAKFYSSLNKVFILMVENRLREDMDDTLLEKLLSVLKEGIQETDNIVSTSEGQIGFIECLLKYSQPLFEKLFLSLKNKAALSDSIKVFTFRLIGMLVEIGEVFETLKNTELFMELSKLFKNNAVNLFASSIQGATLCCFFSIAKHTKGVMWLLEQNILDFPFSYFMCTSYYVRKQAIQSFVDAFSQWTSPEFSFLPPTQRNMLDKTIERIVAQLVEGADFNADTDDTTISDCCILTLKQSIKIAYINKLVCTQFRLIEQISNYFKSLNKGDKIKYTVQDLLLAIYSSENDSNKEAVIKETITNLIKHHLFVPAIHLASSFLKIVGRSRHLATDELHLLLLPLYVLSGTISLNNDKEIFNLTSDVIYSSLMTEIERKSSYINLISSSLSALSSLTSCMDPIALESVLTSIDITGNGFLSQQNHVMNYMCLESRKICSSLLDLFSSILDDAVYSTMNLNSKTILMQYMLCFLERPSYDCNVQCEVLKHLKTLIALNSKHGVVIQDELKDKLVLLLCRKVVDKKESVIDSSLHLVTQLFSKESIDDWKVAISNHNLIMIVWNLAIYGTNEGFLQASALKAVTESCLTPFCWEIVKTLEKDHEYVHVQGREQLNLNFYFQIDFLNQLRKFFYAPDFFVQRESLSCIFKFIKSNIELLLNVKCSENVFSTLLCAVKSLDLELKLIALDFWQWLLESTSCFNLSDKNGFVIDLCESGFGKSLMLAVGDYDDAVRFKANNILLVCQNKMVSMGHHSKGLIDIEEILMEDPMPEDSNEICIEPIGLGERINGLNNVMNLTTLECMLRISKQNLEQTDNHKQDTISMTIPRSCSVKSFWSCVWSANLDYINLNSGSLPILSEHSISLLDDIIAAEKTEMDTCINDIPDCY